MRICVVFCVAVCVECAVLLRELEMWVQGWIAALWWESEVFRVRPLEWVLLKSGPAVCESELLHYLYFVYTVFTVWSAVFSRKLRSRCQRSRGKSFLFVVPARTGSLSQIQRSQEELASSVSRDRYFHRFPAAQSRAPRAAFSERQIDYIIPGREKLLRGARRRSLCVWLWQLSRRCWIRRGRFCSPALSSPTMADSAPSKLFLRPHYAARLPRRTAPPLPPAFGRSGAAHSWLSALMRVTYVCVRWSEREHTFGPRAQRNAWVWETLRWVQCGGWKEFQRRRMVLFISSSPASSRHFSAHLCSVWFVLSYALYMSRSCWVREDSSSFCL